MFRRAVEIGSFNAVSEIAEFTAARAKQNCTDLEIVDQGILRGSIAAKVVKRAGLIVGTVFASAKHGVWVELGRAGIVTNPTTDRRAAKAAWPPVSVIAKWVARNFKKLAPAGRTKSGRARKPKQDDIDRATYLIGRKIYLHGIKPRPFIGPAFNLFKGQFVRRLRFHVDAAVVALGVKR